MLSIFFDKVHFRQEFVCVVHAERENFLNREHILFSFIRLVPCDYIGSKCISILADHLSFIMFGAILVQMQYQSMEIVDSVDNLAPAYGDPIDI